MRFLRTILVAALVATTAAPVLAQDFPALFRVVGVASNDVLNIRAEPSARAPIVGSFRPGERDIEVIGRNEAGTWGLVNVDEGTGWSSLRYLERETGEGWAGMGVPLTCFGTEPFWLARYMPDFARLEVEVLGEGTDAFGVTWTGGIAGRPPYGAGMSLSGDGFATFRGGTCSDGMSDRLYGISVLLYPGPGDGFEGCCSLAR